MSAEALGRAESPDADSQERLLRVRALTWEADGVLSLDLAGPAGVPLPAWKPGAHGCPWRLVYGGKRRASMAFLDRLAGFREHVVVRPEDEFGLLDLDDALRPVEPEAAVLCCGPEPLLAAVERRCAAQRRELRVERFAAKPQVAAGPATSFEVVCRRSGVTTTAGAGESVLEAIERAGVPVAYSCQDEICGTCETRVLAGEPEHRDSIPTDQERAAGDTILICVSRCRSARLVLDR